MNIGSDLDKVTHDDLLGLYYKTNEFIEYLNNEIETAEVEKKGKNE